MKVFPLRPLGFLGMFSMKQTYSDLGKTKMGLTRRDRI